MVERCVEGCLDSGFDAWVSGSTIHKAENGNWGQRRIDKCTFIIYILSCFLRKLWWTRYGSMMKSISCQGILDIQDKWPIQGLHLLNNNDGTRTKFYFLWPRAPLTELWKLCPFDSKPTCCSMEDRTYTRCTLDRREAVFQIHSFTYTTHIYEHHLCTRYPSRY